MKYNPPAGSLDPDAGFVTGTPGLKRGSPIPGPAVEYPQREIINVITAAGLTPSNEALDQLEQAIRLLIAGMSDYEKYDVGQYYWFEDELSRPGLFACLGGLVTNVSQRFPHIVDYLQTTHGQKRLVTQAQYDALHVDTWHTNADGTKVGWEGIGGVNKFVLDLDADTLRLPDLAGMSPEMVGSGSLGVGDVDGDRVKDFFGNFAAVNYHLFHNISGIFKGTDGGNVVPSQSVYGVGYSNIQMIASQVLPTGDRTAPRRWISMGCVYLGRPVS